MEWNLVFSSSNPLSSKGYINIKMYPLKTVLTRPWTGCDLLRPFPTWCSLTGRPRWRGWVPCTLGSRGESPRRGGRSSAGSRPGWPSTCSRHPPLPQGLSARTDGCQPPARNKHESAIVYIFLTLICLSRKQQIVIQKEKFTRRWKMKNIIVTIYK